MYSPYYILDRNNHAMRVESIIQWGMWFERARNKGTFIVKQEQVGPFYISTVFLGIDHNHSGKGRPLLFETMVFESEKKDREMSSGSRNKKRDISPWTDLEMERCSTWNEAVAQHERVAASVKEKLSNANILLDQIATGAANPAKRGADRNGSDDS